MATQQYGYGPNVWAPATPTGPVDMPTLSQPGGAAPQFKPKSPFAAAAAKMVGEMAYGAMQEKAAPKYMGIDPITQKPIYEIQPNSSQFEPETGWTFPKNEDGIETHILKRNLAVAHKEFEIAQAKNENLFENRRLMSNDALEAQAKSAATNAAPNSALSKYEGIGLADRGIDMGGFEVPDEPVVPVVTDPKVVPFIDDNASSLEKAYVTEPVAFADAIRIAAEPYKASFFDMWTPDFAKKQDDKLQDNENEAFMRWANDMQYENGAGAHFAINSATPNYEAFKLYKANPLEYWRKNIKTQE